jgi:hypothetical protein
MKRTELLLLLLSAGACDARRLRPLDSRPAARLPAGEHAMLQRGRRSKRSSTMAELAPFYHSSDDIDSELTALASRCPGMSLRTVQSTGDDGEERSITVVDIKAPGSQPVNKNFLLFGEHARELISPESGLHFVKTLCGETGLSSRAKEVLKSSEFEIVVNGNPGSRRKVEQGDFCLRVNPDGVDLNRNWDEEWQPGAVLDAKDTNPGPKAFSEPETKVFKQLTQDYRPTTFLTIHSGTKGMYMPWAYDMEHLANRNQPQMMQILKDLDKDHCECPFGAAGKEVGYSCPGTCLDWVYDKLQTAYAFAFEIYAGSDYTGMLRERWQEKLAEEGGSLIQQRSHLAHEHFHDFFTAHPSNFVQMNRSHLHHDSEMHRAPTECFAQFNPSDEDEFKGVVDNWSGAYLDMADMVARQLRGSSSNKSTASLASMSAELSFAMGP